jgi:choline-phosphate cytidylyltransferase
LILRIVKDYDGYVRRNLSRGFKGKDMNISFLREYRIKLEESFKNIKFTANVSGNLIYS